MIRKKNKGKLIGADNTHNERYYAENKTEDRSSDNARQNPADNDGNKNKRQTYRSDSEIASENL